MRSILAVPILLLCVAGPGCQLMTNAARNWSNELSQFTERCNERSRNNHLAEDAWRKVTCSQPTVRFSDDYACGFKAGFADYLEYGGTGEPPPIPPRHYWHTCYETPKGYHAMEEWFAGFRHGSSMAQASGVRNFVTIPVAVPAPPPPVVGPAPQPPVVAAPPVRPNTEILPEPREVKPPVQKIRPEVSIPLPPPMIKKAVIEPLRPIGLPPTEELPIIPEPNAPARAAPIIPPPIRSSAEATDTPAKEELVVPVTAKVEADPNEPLELQMEAVVPEPPPEGYDPPPPLPPPVQDPPAPPARMLPAVADPHPAPVEETQPTMAEVSPPPSLGVAQPVDGKND